MPYLPDLDWVVTHMAAIELINAADLILLTHEFNNSFEFLVVIPIRTSKLWPASLLPEVFQILPAGVVSE